MIQTVMPRAFTPEQLEEGRLLFSGPCDFFFGAQNVQQLPPPKGPEVAFAGRSNVGKSSLINALTSRSRLARASSEPGRTKQLNFFLLSSRMTLVDMPGYGFAKAAKSVKEEWQQMMFAYLRGRPSLTRVFLLLDARIELKPADHSVMTMLDHAAVTFQIVLTKIDGVKAHKLEAKVDEVRAVCAQHAAAYPDIAMTSSETGLGLEMLRAEIARVISPT